MTDSNPFASAETWDVSTGTFLAAGNHKVTIRSVDGSGVSSGGYPQIEVEVGNDQGTIRDWIVITPNTVGKVTQLTDAAGLGRPTDAQVKQDGSGFRIDPAYLAQLVNRTIGVVVRAEPDNRNPGQTRDRVKGYVDPSKIGTSDLPTMGSAGGFDSSSDTVVGNSTFPSAVAGATNDDKIPF